MKFINVPLQAVTVLGFLLLTTATSASPVWQSNNIFLLHGQGYEVNADKQTTITLEHASGWSKGDLFAFVDFTKFHSSNDNSGYYGEISPRLSLGKITGKDFSTGLIKDVLVAFAAEFGEGDVEGYLIGPGFDLNVPGFNFVSFNIYKRFITTDRDGETIQITTAWNKTTSLWNSTLTFAGYIDWNLDNDGFYQSNIHFNPRLKYDLGPLLNIAEKKATVGLEYSYWKNKYGIEDSPFFDTDESALSLFINYTF